MRATPLQETDRQLRGTGGLLSRGFREEDEEENRKEEEKKEQTGVRWVDGRRDKGK